jgi:hypothetical protein
MVRLVRGAGRKLLESGGGCVGADEVVTMRQASDSFGRNFLPWYVVK